MASWDVAEITVEAHYIGNDPDTLTLPCKLVLEVPGVYEHKVAADGTVMRSEAEPPSLLAKGIDLRVLDAIGWEPNLLSFKDSRTGERREFQIVRRYTQEPSAAKFALR